MNGSTLTLQGLTSILGAYIKLQRQTDGWEADGKCTCCWQASATPSLSTADTISPYIIDKLLMDVLLQRRNTSATIWHTLYKVGQKTGLFCKLVTPVCDDVERQSTKN